MQLFMVFASCKYDINSITYLDLLAVRTPSCFFHLQLWKVSIYTCCTSPLSKKLWCNVNVNKNRKQWMSWTFILSTIEHRKHIKSLKCNILLFHRNFKLIFSKNLGKHGGTKDWTCMWWVIGGSPVWRDKSGKNETIWNIF